jgi:hypothetical protein
MKHLLVTCCMKDGGLYRLDLTNSRLEAIFPGGDFRGIAKYRHRLRNYYIVVSNDDGILKLDRHFSIIQQNKVLDLDFHGAAVYRNCAYIVETATNTIGIYEREHLSRIGEIRLSLFNDDVLHVNDLDFSGDRLFISMFSDKPGWREQEGRSGVILEYSLSKHEIVQAHCRQLNKPHSVICSSDGLYYCNTFDHTVMKGSELIVRTSKYPRGLAVTDDTLFVGLSVSRQSEEQDERAEIMVYNRSAQTSQYVAVPCKEIYSLLLI